MTESKIIFLKRRGEQNLPLNKFYFENELPLLGTADDFDRDNAIQ